MKKPFLALLPALALCACNEPPPPATSTPTTAVAAAKPREKAPVSFQENVAYAFLTRCADCHVQTNKGGLDLSTFAALMKGGENGPVVVAGKPDESKLVQLIEADKMPAKGDPLTEEFKTDIREWVEKGAQFDGPDVNAKLTDYVLIPEEADPRGGGGGGGAGRRGGRGGGWNPFARFDKNDDEKLTKDEVEGRMKERFDDFDADKDGSITQEEFTSRMESRSGGRGRGDREPGDGESRPQRPPFDAEPKAATPKSDDR